MSSNSQIVSSKPAPVQAVKTSSSNLVHFLAGGAGGSIAAIATCPLEVIKTRLQALHKANVGVDRQFGTRIVYAFVDIWKNEGVRGLWRGIGPNLLGVAPARALHFTTYNFVKRLCKNLGMEEGTQVHFVSAIVAGATVHTVTAPVWLVKTRMQLQSNRVIDNMIPYKNSFDCARRVFHEEGIRGFYKGLIASYVGVSETAIQFVLYEKGKAWLQNQKFKNAIGDGQSLSASEINQLPLSWKEYLLVASGAKLIAAALTYPHEVVRTRMREQRDNLNSKYKGFVQALKLIAKEEGARGLYGGMFPHLVRTVPNSAIMFLTYETVVRILSKLEIS